MDAPVSPSFIPKKPLTGGAGSHGTSAALGMFIFFICLLVFIASVVAAGGAFLYQGYLTTSLANKKTQLQQQESSIDQSTITHLKRLDSRLNQTEVQLQKHTTALNVFAFLSQQTKQNVQFTSFDYSMQPDGSAKLTLTGVADSFATVALQSDQFGASTLLHNVVFSSITVGADGRISFSVAADIDPSLVSYAKNLSASVLQATTTPQTTGSSTPALQ
jgi:Tfp pilus assembly protein PilN